MSSIKKIKKINLFDFVIYIDFFDFFDGVKKTKLLFTYSLTFLQIILPDLGNLIPFPKSGSILSTSSNFGKSGKYVINGSSLTVTMSTGKTLSLSIAYRSGTMIWEGSDNGYRFHYEFSKQ